MEVGAGTMSPDTFLRVLGPKPVRIAYAQPSRRPADGRYGENPNRLFRHTQFQVVLKPPPVNVQELYLESLTAIGIDLREHDIKFEEDNWEWPVGGAWGVGWQVMLDGLEITQFTYFQQCGGMELDPIYGRDYLRAGADRGVSAGCGLDLRDRMGGPSRIAGRRNDLWRDPAGQRRSSFRRTGSTMPMWRRSGNICGFTKRSAKGLLSKAEGLEKMDGVERTSGFRCSGAYELALKCSQLFNLLDARGSDLGDGEGGRDGKRIRNLVVGVAKVWATTAKVGGKTHAAE